MSDITPELIEQILYWSELSYTYFVFFLAAETIWCSKHFDFRGLTVPEDIDMFEAFSDPCMKEYYRMKEKLEGNREKYEKKGV